MECPHLCDSVKVNRDFIKNKKCELTTSTTGNTAQATNTTSISTSTSSSTAPTSNGKLWKCLGMN